MVAWELLIGLFGIAVSVFFGLNSLNKRIATMGREIATMSERITTMSREIATRYDVLAALFALSKSSSEGRPIGLEDIREGYDLAENLLGSIGEKEEE